MAGSDLNRLAAGVRICPNHDHPFDTGSLGPFKYLSQIMLKIIVINMAVAINKGWHSSLFPGFRPDSPLF